LKAPAARREFFRPISLNALDRLEEIQQRLVKISGVRGSIVEHPCKALGLRSRGLTFTDSTCELEMRRRLMPANIHRAINPALRHRKVCEILGVRSVPFSP
jgi:hypothetical protein